MFCRGSVLEPGTVINQCVLVQMGEVLFEERLYPAGKWACVTHREHLYEQSISMSFMKLMRFICKENSAGEALPPPPHRL